MDQEILKQLCESAKKDLEFYSNKGKTERERWVVEEFLRVMIIPFESFEIKSLEQQSKIDIEFRDARFQVKEIINPDIKRSDFYKEQYNSFANAKNLENIDFPTIVEDVPPVAKMYDLILSETKKLSHEEKYQDSKSNLDLIFYISRSRASILKTEEINSDDFSGLGWRSVSCVNSKQAAVLFAGKDSPVFLGNAYVRE